MLAPSGQTRRLINGREEDFYPDNFPREYKLRKIRAAKRSLIGAHKKRALFQQWLRNPQVSADRCGLSCFCELLQLCRRVTSWVHFYPAEAKAFIAAQQRLEQGPAIEIKYDELSVCLQV